MSPEDPHGRAERDRDEERRAIFDEEALWDEIHHAEDEVRREEEEQERRQRSSSGPNPFDDGRYWDDGEEPLLPHE